MLSFQVRLVSFVDLWYLDDHHDDRVFSFGNNRNGELGLGNTTNHNIPTVITALDGKRIVSAAMGSYHTIFVDSNGGVYCCGHNNHGQLGLGDTTCRSTPTLLANAFDGKKVVDVATNHNSFCFASCSDGVCFAIVAHLFCRFRLWLGPQQ